MRCEEIVQQGDVGVFPGLSDKHKRRGSDSDRGRVAKRTFRVGERC